MTDTLTIDNQSFTIGKLVLSPTRTYLPLLKKMLSDTEGVRDSIHGIIHNTGGGQTKVLKFVKNKRIIKDNLLPIPPLFHLIQSESKTDWREMYQVFNMGHRLEVYCEEKIAERLVEIGQFFNIDAKIIGRVAENPSGESLNLTHEGQTFSY